MGREKVTFSEFFRVQVSVFRELFTKYRTKSVVLTILSFVTITSSLIKLKFVEYITNAVTGYFDGTVAFSSLLITAALFLGSLLLMIILSNLQEIITMRYRSDISFDVGCKITKKLSEIPYEYYEFSSFHDKINHAREASEAYSQAVYGSTEIISTVLRVAVYGVLLSRISPLYLLVIATAIVLCVIISSKVTEKRMINKYKNLSPNDRRSAYFGCIMSDRVNHQNIQTTRNYPFFSNTYGKFNELTRRAGVKENIMSFASDGAVVLMFAASFFATVIVVGRGVALGTFTLGYFTMVTALLADLFWNVRDFTFIVINHTGYAKAVGAYFEIMEIGSEEDKEKEEGDGSVSVKDLKYKYPQSELYALDGVTLSFKKGEKVAVVGHNGSGKTTMMAIIARLLRSYEGELHEGGAVVSAVMQDFVHYQMTVKESIELGCGGRELSEEKIFEILKKVELYDFIMSKPKGIDTNIGQLEEDGVELSKGQYQRLAIARLLANEDSNVWILDEPTAFLDPIAEIETYRHIFDLAGDRLVFFISHRLGFAKHADRIIVTEDGRIVEDGSHSELIARENSVYKRMFESQKEWFE